MQIIYHLNHGNLISMDELARLVYGTEAANGYQDQDSGMQETKFWL